MPGESRGGENRGRYFVLGLVLGGLLGAGLAVWVMESKRVRFRQQSGGIGGRVAEFISVVRDEFIPGLKDAVKQSVEEAESAEGFSPGEDRFKEPRES